MLIAYKNRFNRGFEVPMSFEYEQKQYHLRMIILFDHGLCARKRKTIDDRIEQTKVQFQELATKLNRYKLKTEQSIDHACADILRGRPSKNAKPELIAVVQDHFHVQLDFDQNAYQQALSRCGYYPLLDQ